MKSEAKTTPKVVVFLEGSDEPFFGITVDSLFADIGKVISSGELDVEEGDMFMVYQLSESFRYESNPGFKKISK